MGAGSSAAASNGAGGATSMQSAGPTSGSSGDVGEITRSTSRRLTRATERSSMVVLEVNSTGFRLLRPLTNEPLYEFLYPQIHSWVSHETRFGFRFYDKSKKLHYFTFLFKFPDGGKASTALLDTIHGSVQDILQERLSKAMGEEQFKQFLTSFENTILDEQLPLLRETTQTNYFSSEQAYQVVCKVKDVFSRVDAAVLFHKAITDQTRYSRILDAFDDDLERQNVWQRVDEAKKAKSRTLKAVSS
ncbi:DUF4476 domain-containing protein [Pycnococcus provasolii]